MNKRLKKLLVILLPALLISIFLLLYTEKKGSKKDNDISNIIVILADALRYDVLGCYGGDAKTPNIDLLARKGVLFENAYSNAPCTLPASVTIITGNYSRTYSILLEDEYKNTRQKYSFYVNDDEKLFSELLKERNYDVKMDVENGLAKRSNNFQGFEEFRKINQMDDKEIAIVEKTIGIKNINFNKNTLLSSQYSRLYDFLFYILTVPDNRNFFLFKWFFDPHGPYNPPEKFKRKISVDRSKLSERESFYSHTSLGILNKRLIEKKISDYELYYLKELYKAEVESLDERVGYIIKALKLRGFFEKSIIVFTSDYGDFLGEHGRLAHGHAFYEEAVHVPLIISGPGVPEGKKEKTFISHLDLIPTLKDLMKEEFADEIQGKSFNVLFSGFSLRDRIIYFDRINNLLVNNANTDALLMNGYKLIVKSENNSDSCKLFNIITDPGETKDVSKEKSEIVQIMFQKILNIRKKNRIRLEKNLRRMKNHVNPDKELKKTLKLLQTFGYIQN